MIRDQDVLSYSLVEGPENMTIDPSSGAIKWEYPGQGDRQAQREGKDFRRTRR